jgi:hypothetical protein
MEGKRMLHNNTRRDTATITLDLECAKFARALEAYKKGERERLSAEAAWKAFANKKRGARK